MNLLGEPAFVGRHCGSGEHEITREVVDFYRAALDDANPLYDEIAPPLLYHSECYRFAPEWYLKNIFGNLHTQQDWELFAPIPIGSRVRSRSTIVERYHKRGRDYENSISIDYLSRLNERYEAWVTGYKLGKLLIVDVDQCNFSENMEDLRNATMIWQMLG